MHSNTADRNTHEQMGFYDGWGTVTRQLAELTEHGPEPDDTDDKHGAAGHRTDGQHHEVDS